MNVSYDNIQEKFQIMKKIWLRS